MSFFRQIFEAHASPSSQPLADQDIIFYGNTDFSHVGTEPRLQNFQHILRTGIVQENSVNDEGLPSDWANMRIDLNADDSFARSIRQVTGDVQRRMMEDERVQSLMRQPHWDRAERVQYERRLAEFTEEEMSRIPSLGLYRMHTAHTENDPLAQLLGRMVTSTPNLNDLSRDIDNNSARFRWDCSRQSAVQGMIMQMVENDLLPQAAEPGNLHVRSNYFRAIGVFEAFEGQSPRDGMPPNDGSHAWILSSATGNIIEATAENPRSAYMEHIDPSFSFERFALGQPFISRTGEVYKNFALPGSFSFVRDEHNFQINFNLRDFYDAIPNRVSLETTTNKTIFGGLIPGLSPEAEALIENKRVVEHAGRLIQAGGLEGEQLEAVLDRGGRALNSMEQFIRWMPPQQRLEVMSELLREKERIALEDARLQPQPQPDHTPMDRHPDVPIPDYRQQAPLLVGPQ